MSDAGMASWIQTTAFSYPKSGRRNIHKENSVIIDLTEDGYDDVHPSLMKEDWRNSYKITASNNSFHNQRGVLPRFRSSKKATPIGNHSSPVIDLTSSAYVPLSRWPPAAPPKSFQNGDETPSQVVHDIELGPDEGTTNADSRVPSETGLSPKPVHASERTAPVAKMYSRTASPPEDSAVSALNQQQAKDLPVNSNVAEYPINGTYDVNHEVEVQLAHNKHHRRREEKNLAMEAEKKEYAAKERSRLPAMIPGKASEGAQQFINPIFPNPDICADSDKAKRSFYAFSGLNEGLSNQKCNEAARGSSAQVLTRYHCCLCEGTFSRRDSVKSHFPICAQKNGNPAGKSWDDHRSCWPKKKSVTCDATGQPSNSNRSSFHCTSCRGTFTQRHDLTQHFDKCSLKNGNPDSKTSISHESRIQKEHKHCGHGVDNPIDTTAASDTKCNQGQAKTCDLGQSVLKANRKRTLHNIPVSMLFNPKQVATRKEFEQHAEKKRRKMEEKKQRAAAKEQIEDGIAEAVREVSGNLPAHDETQAETETLIGLPQTVTIFPNESSTKTDRMQEFARERLALTEDAEKEPLQTINEPPASERKKSEEVLPPDKSDHQDATPVPVSRPTTSGKRISEETLAFFATQGGEACDDDKDEILELPEVVYVYFLSLSNWGAGLSEAKAIKKCFGPFYTVAEANIAAAVEVKFPLERLENMAGSGFDDSYPLYLKTGWSYNFSQNEHGMQTHRLSVGGLHAEAVVQRGASPTQWPFTKQNIPLMTPNSRNPTRSQQKTLHPPFRLPDPS